MSHSTEGKKRIGEGGARLRVRKLAVRAAYSTDGSCGPQHGNTICDPNSKVYTASLAFSILLSPMTDYFLGNMLFCKHARRFVYRIGP